MYIYIVSYQQQQNGAETFEPQTMAFRNREDAINEYRRKCVFTSGHADLLETQNTPKVDVWERSVFYDPEALDGSYIFIEIDKINLR